jgi:probable phosphoglycerate mutase
MASHCHQFHLEKKVMSLILLVRHGENNYVKKNILAGRLPEVHLNEKGRSQAQAVAEKLKSLPIKAVYSSPLERAMETAEPLAKALGLEIVQRPGLIELEIGEWQGQPLKSLQKLKAWRKVQGNPSRFRFPGGETFLDTQHRICSELEALAALHQPKEIIACISHADPIKLAVAYYLGMPLDHFQRLSVSPGSITAIFLGEMGAQLVTLNYDLSLSLPGV